MLHARRMLRLRDMLPAVRPEGSAPTDLDDLSLYINRELTWLELNQRVLDQATSPEHPLLERVKFLAIVASNLDEFFMVRVATLLKKERTGVEEIALGGLTVSQQLAAIRKRAALQMADQAACWQDTLRPALARHGVRFVEPSEYDDTIRRALASYFRTDIFPLLTPLAFDPEHPFPLISNRSKNLAVVVRHQGHIKFARVKVPDVLPRFVPIPGAEPYRFAFLEDVIRTNLDRLFPDVEIVSAHVFRILRDTDI